METEQRDLLIELRTQSNEILRRMSDYDKNIILRPEYTVTVNELRDQHRANQVEIASIQAQLIALIWKVGVALGTINVISSLVLFLITKA